MTTETRTTIEPGDIIAIEFECVKCHARTIRPFNNWLQDPSGCNNCGEQWMLQHSGDFKNLQQLIGLVRAFSDFPDGDGRPFKLRFELSKQ